EGRLLGLVSRTDALRWQGGDDLGDATLAETLSDVSQPVAYPDSPCGVVADLIVETGIGRIPIIDRATRRVVGILSRQDLLKARSAHRESETTRIRFMGLSAAGSPQTNKPT
ncbi:MAG TPA: CBS domain-containing protein, partial [Rhodoblastus sp.]|nr:CBS domain-containing protein [Rhodoblastus sp.]